MDISEENLKTLANYLVQTLSPEREVRVPAEKFLESVEINKGYGLLLLTLVTREDLELTIRVAGAISFKNYVKRNWKIEEGGESKIDEEDRARMKERIVEAMLGSPPMVQKQLCEAVGTIGKYDFPRKWPSLLTSMVEKFSTGDFHVINGILQTAHSIFKRYRYEFKSQELWEEIKFVLDTFAQPLTELAVATQNLAEQQMNNAGNTASLKVIYSSLLLIAKIFYSLNSQDLPEFFEDNMNIWMPLFHKQLTSQVQALETQDDSEAGLLEELRSQICSNVTQYVQKYDEEFQPYLSGFVTSIWNLLVTVSQQPKYDMLVSNALQFLSTVAEKPQHRHLFEDRNVLAGICENVIIPNIHFRESDMELFEDNPEEYIRRDMEGSDTASRRRSAADLVKVLSSHFPDALREIFGASVQAMLDEYSRDEGKWWKKNAGVYIVMSLAERGSTAKHGVTKASDIVQLPEFTQSHILPELAKDINILPIMKADSIKFIITFRSILPQEILLASFPAIVQHLTSNSQVVHSYASMAVDKLLILRRPGGQPLLSEDILVPIAGGLLKGLFGIFVHPGSEENEFAMKGVLRSFSALNERVIPYLGEYLPRLTEKLAEVAKNPRKPQFNHYLFEAIAMSIRIVCGKSKEAVNAFEEALFPIFQIIFQQDVQEFAPYCMQILSLTLGTRAPSSGLPQPYIALYSSLVTPQLWERAGCIRGLSSLMKSYVRVASINDFNMTVKIPGLLGIFQKLISSRLNDHFGFEILQSLITYCPRELLSEYMKQVVLLLFQRLTAAKTTKFTKCLVVLFCLLISKYGASTFINLVDSIQPQMFAMVTERLFIPECNKVTDNSERKVVAVGLAGLVSEKKEVFSGGYAAIWPGLTKTLLEVVESCPATDGEGDEGGEGLVEVDDLPGYDPAYVQLAATASASPDLLPEVTDLRREVASKFKVLYVEAGEGFLTATRALGDPYLSLVAQYLALAGISI